MVSFLVYHFVRGHLGMLKDVSPLNIHLDGSERKADLTVTRMVGIVLTIKCSGQVQHLCWLSLEIIIDWRVVAWN